MDTNGAAMNLPTRYYRSAGNSNNTGVFSTKYLPSTRFVVSGKTQNTVQYIVHVAVDIKFLYPTLAIQQDIMTTGTISI